MRVSVRMLAPALVVAALGAGGVWIQSGLAQPERAPARPAAPSQPSQQNPPVQSPLPGQPGRGPGGQPGGPGGPGRMMSLEGAMRMMNRGFRELKANIADASKREENLASVWTMQQGCAAAKRGKPEQLEGDPAEALESFRREQINLMRLLVTLEAALMDSKADEALAALEEIKAFQKESHEKYQVKEEDEEENGPGGPGGPQGPRERPPPQPGGR